MADGSALVELERRVRKDPASPLFGRLADEYRLAGRHADAIEVCRAGLALRPDYHSARVTLARALMQLGHYTKARDEFERVLRAAPDNLAALRGLEEIADTHAGWAHPSSSSPPTLAVSAVPAHEIPSAGLALPGGETEEPLSAALDVAAVPDTGASDAAWEVHAGNASGSPDGTADAATVVDAARVVAAADVVDLVDVAGLVDVVGVADMADISGAGDAVGVAGIALTLGPETADATDADEEAMLQARRGAVAALIGLEHFLSLVIARREALEAAPPGR